MRQAMPGPAAAPPAVPLFDASPGARPLFKERALWVAVMGLFFFLAYGGANEIAALGAPHPALYMGWERAIPFIPAFILPYMSSDILFVAAFLAAADRDALQRLALRCGLAIALSAAIFVAMPLQLGFERPAVEGWTAPVFAFLGLDRPYNQFPSLHISLGFLAWHTLDRRLGKAWRLPLAAWFLAIAASTLLVWQHHFIDLPGGAAVAALVFWLVPERGPGRVPVRFVSPRHLDMALRYLAPAFLAAAVAILKPALALPLGWLSLSLTGIAGAYVLGLNGFLGKRRSGHHVFTWLAFWPYLIGIWVIWRLWRGRVAPMVEVEPGLWLGIRPGGGDWGRVEAAGVAAVVDLVPELASTPPEGMTHDHLPLLDIAIPAPAALDEIARTIEHRRRAGGVYVHCALGKARGVLAVCAWMMHRGMTAEQALAAIDRVRPERVRRPYMRIALDLYADYLAAQQAGSK
jgi:membrane-associated phospholipid phosphatase